MRADNHGEGGILALMPLAGATRFDRGRALVVMGLFGAALIYGDGIVTSAISVLSAPEGVNVASELLDPYVMPVAVAILLCIFAAQGRGTARIGKVFGPVMLLWFAVIAVLGVGGILRHPSVLTAVDPRHAIAFVAEDGWGGFAVLGGVFLAITGGEALYADMGHIGRNPIRTTWCGLVLPALLLNYAGQTALLLEHPILRGNPFFKLAPDWAIFPLVLLATVAAIIASQASITGSFPLTRQGDATRLVSRLADPPDLGRRIRANLRSLRDLDDDAVPDRPDGRLRQVRPPRQRVWHHRLDHHAVDDGSDL
jgi:KUP system potassium uptake protein